MLYTYPKYVDCADVDIAFIHTDKKFIDFNSVSFFLYFRIEICFVAQTKKIRFITYLFFLYLYD